MYRFCCRTTGPKLFVSPSLTVATQWSPMLLHHVLRPGVPSQQAVRSLRTTLRLSNAPRPTTIQNVTKPFEAFPHGAPVPPKNVLKALLFTGAFSIGCFLGATMLEYENARSLMIEKIRKAKLSWPLKRGSRQTESSKWSQIKQEVNLFWDRLTPGERVFVPICALNLLVFAMWRVPALKQFMMNYFTSNPVGRAICWPMFLSTFSHYSAFHIFANMYVLHSFSNAAVMSMGKEQFLAVYLSAGVIASMSSIFYKAITANVGLSLGASGAIMAILGYVCNQFPETQLSLLFVPGLTFSAASAIKFIIGVDLAGCLLGWKFFDHAAHLGGVLFGSFWAFYGADIWRRRIKFLSIYHDWRKTK